jgi:hypothetical protein
MRKAFWRISRSETNGVSKLSAKKLPLPCGQRDDGINPQVFSTHSNFRCRLNYYTVETEGQLFNFTGMLLGASLVHTGLFHHYFLAPKNGSKWEALLREIGPFSNLISPVFHDLRSGEMSYLF